MESIESFISLLDCQSEADWHGSIVKLGNSFGFEQTLIAVAPQKPTALSESFLRSNYSPKWLDTYEKTHLVGVDPTVAHCLSKSTPLIWRPEIFRQKKQLEMYEEALGYGLRSGVTLPFHGTKGEVGILCFVSDTQPTSNFMHSVSHHLPELSLLRDFAFEASLKFVEHTSQSAPPPVTKRELECLKWCADGKSSWEIAKILSCSEAAVNFHFGNLRSKFNATSRRQVVVKAIHCGVIRT